MAPGVRKITFKKSTLIVLAALIAIAAGAVHNEMLGPRVRADPIRADDPLTMRFAIFNPAFTVSLKNIDMTCVPLSIEGHDRSGHAWTAKAQSFPLDVDIDLGPRMAFEYTCPLAATPARQIDRVRAQVAVRYTRFGHRDETVSGTLAWDAASRVWTLMDQR